ncbi:carboxypeptidase-like regulatory domain-containing protein [Paenibacillus cookii]|uniref:Carboxypeptidase regulatory-like domain-containing protein n=1 Tax=Paenibacillus cookii TaxID=157839 RepID=A0ABQ4M5R0_9BACL|nr:carboxypeptidase-like regulatory domain-containing protein [Paenibacillus cookii]GIO70261.1 hypothetical protein J21TS3_50820 [Paenibacillus cookii]
MKIRVKIKHLAYGAGLLLAVILAVAVMAKPPQNMAGAGQTGAEAKEQVLRKIAAAGAEEKLKLIEEYMLKDDSADLSRAYDMYIESTGMMYGGGVVDVAKKPVFSLDEKLPYLEQYAAEGKPGPELAAAAKLLSYHYQGEGQQEKAAKVLAEARKRLHSSTAVYASNELLLMQAQLAAGQKQYDTLLKLCAEIIDRNAANDDILVRMSELLAQYAIEKGEVPQTLELLRSDLEQKSSRMTSGQAVQIQKEELRGITDRLKKIASGRPAGLTDVSGTIAKANGEPLAYAGVFLRRDDDLNHSMAGFEPYQTITNEKGEYAFKGVVPGRYKLYLGVNASQLNGWTWPEQRDGGWIDLNGQQAAVENVTFQPLLELREPVNNAIVKDSSIAFAWEPVQGAAYYNLSVGIKLKSGSTSRVVRRGISVPEVRIQADDLYYEYTGISGFSEGSGQLTIDPLSLLGYANTDNQMTWDVAAYDAGGRMLTRSGGYRLDERLTDRLPFFYLKAREMTEADRTLLSGDLKKAEAMYRADYRKDPDDAHSLHMIIRLLQGTMMLEGKGAGEAEESLLAEQTRLLRQLVKLHPAAWYYDMLAQQAFDRADWDEYRRYDELAAALDTSEDTGYRDGTRAIAFMRQQKWDEAAASFQKSLENDPSHRFIGAYIALTIARGSPLETAAALAEKYPDRMSYSGPIHWDELLLAMKREAAGQDGYFQTLRQRAGLYVRGGEAGGERSSSSSPAMNRFFEQLKQVK